MPACSLCTMAMLLNHLEGKSSAPYLNTKALQSNSEHFILKRTLKIRVHLKHSDRLYQRSGIPGRKRCNQVLKFFKGRSDLLCEQLCGVEEPGTYSDGSGNNFLRRPHFFMGKRVQVHTSY